jgi:hypothetical protein
VSDQRQAPAASPPPRKDPRYPLYRRLGGPQPVSTQRLEENSFASAGDRISIAWTSSLWSGTILTELPQLLKLKETVPYFQFPENLTFFVYLTNLLNVTLSVLIGSGNI